MLSKLVNKITKSSTATKTNSTNRHGKRLSRLSTSIYKRLRRQRRLKSQPAICTPRFGHAGASLNLLNTWAEIEENTVIITSGYLPPDSPLILAIDKHYIKVDGKR